jgi:hypothetical protein
MWPLPDLLACGKTNQGLANVGATFNPGCRKVSGPCSRHRISPHRLEDDMGTDMATIDEEQVAELLGRFVNDLGVAGFRTFRRVAETPFNLVCAARP